MNVVVGQIDLFVKSAFKNCSTSGDLCLYVFDRHAVAQQWCAPTDISAIVRTATVTPGQTFAPPVALFGKALNAQGKRTTPRANVVEAPVIALELDNSPAEGAKHAQQLLGPATIIVRSGGVTPDGQDKLHLYWRLKMPACTPSEIESLDGVRKVLAQVCNGDPSGASVVHPMRWPGSWHSKSTPRLCEIINRTENEIGLADAVAMASVFGIKPTKSPQRESFKTVEPLSEEELLRLAKKIPNNEQDWNRWNRTGMAFYDASHGSDAGSTAFHLWSSHHESYDISETELRWQHWFSSPPSDLSAATLYFDAGEHPAADAAKVFGARKAVLPPGASLVPLQIDDILASLSHADNEMQLIAKLLAQYGYCPSRPRPVVPLHTDNDAAGFTFEAFKRDLKKYQRGKVSLAEGWLAWPTRETIRDLRMQADKERPTYREGSNVFVNTYRPPEHNAEGGSLAEWHAFLRHLLPVEMERTWFERWLAYKFLHPEVPGPGVVMVARAFGTGRGTLGQILSALFGKRYVKALKFSNLTNSTYQSQYNEWQAEALLVVVNESLDTNGGGRGRYAAISNAFEHLKELVDPAQREVYISRKGLPNYTSPTFCSFIIATNHADALPLPADDRRFAVLENGDPMSQQLAAAVHAWLADERNISALANYLRHLYLADYSPYAPPPKTNAQAQMTELNMSELDHAVAGAIDSLPSEVFTVRQVIARLPLMTADRQAGARRSIQDQHHRVGERDGKNWRPMINKEREAVYAKTPAAAKRWGSSDHLREEILKNEEDNGTTRSVN